MSVHQLIRKAFKRSVEDTLDYQEITNHVRDLEDTRDLCFRFLDILSTVEESDEGKEFHPVSISSVRVDLSSEVGSIIRKLRNKKEGRL